jgi:hypothetical protein
MLYKKAKPARISLASSAFASPWATRFPKLNALVMPFVAGIAVW